MKLLLKSLILAAAALAAGPAPAQPAYPTKSIRLIVPFPPGGAVDIVGRALAQRLSSAIGQQVVVENKPGANGAVGVDYVAKAAPDGYTAVLSALGAITIIPHAQKTPYDPLKDLVPVTQVVALTLAWVARADLPASNIRDLIKLAQGGTRLAAGTSGNGSPNHLAVEQFNLMAGTHILHVPYKGEGPAITDLVGGQIDLVVTTLIAAAPQLKGGRIKAIAAAGAKRPSAMPELATVGESGLPGYEAQAWQGVFVPAGTPREIVARLNAEIVKILRSAEMRDFLLASGTEPVGNSAAEFTAYVQDESARYGKLIARIGLKLD